MGSLRVRRGKHSKSYSKVTVPEAFEDPSYSLSTRAHHSLSNESSGKQYSLRQRIARSFNRNKSLPEWQPDQYDIAYDRVQARASLLRKSIRSFSSLRGRFSSDSSAEDEIQSQRPSPTRKSFGSMSSSLRGVRNSLSSRRSDSEEQRSATLCCRHCPDFTKNSTPSEYVGPYEVLPKHNTIPQLPDFDEILANTKDKASTDNQSPNTLFSMSIFDGLGSPFKTKRQDNVAVEHDEPVAGKPAPAVGRLPVRIKRIDSVVSKGTIRSRPTQERRPGIPKGSDISSPSSETKGCAGTKPDTSKIPVEWLDSVLEMSILARDGVLPEQKSTTWTEMQERFERMDKRVFVFVPDYDDSSEPWPKMIYPDLRAALKDICGRLWPYYAPFAAYTSLTHTLQLFRRDLQMLNSSELSPGATLIVMGEMLNSWDALSAYSFHDEDDLEEQTITDISTCPMIMTQDGLFERLNGFKRNLEVQDPSILMSEEDLNSSTASQLGFFP
ncbi:uncharacterized protein F4822DRAFT_439685 [Hypoxylon trugodes]|uniref:uncharacterized protein n=1 Tax=Hypoxylon trugodes TaxID=326681 RepID=UPI00219E25A9|nr:uncharacterized protein F4822DRAFT_439685 [Hypoxylon trugodes]KAI1393778.1 hypothetical protein F4822DRAFT_439685 [Hypoxylon trugodes]